MFCKSKVLPDGTFLVETFTGTGGYRDPRETWIVGNVTRENKIAVLDKVLEASGFKNVIDGKCAGKGRECKIYIKANFSSTMEKEGNDYTDPELVDHVAGVLEKDHDNVTIFETETKMSEFSPVFKPDILAKRLDPPYRHDPKNLTPEPRQQIAWKSGTIEVSTPLVNADVIINMGKVKPIAEYRISMALKNMYGALPEADRYHHFHWKRSGFDVEDATLIANHATPSDFTILDGIVSRDFDTKEPFHAGVIVAGRDPLFIDKVLTLKTGVVDQDISTITRREAGFRGNFDARNHLDLVHASAVKNVPGGIDLEPVPDGKKLDVLADSKTGRAWKAPGDIDNVAANMIQFGIPSALNLPDSVIRPFMCFESKYTVMTDAEFAASCPGIPRGIFLINRLI
jgi:uncharacterized protein (DUF362 family)